MRKVRMLHQCISLLLAPLLLLLSSPLAAARLVNRTIDDENGDSVTGAKPTYGPSVDPTGNWIQGLTCVHCTMLPGKVINISQTFNGTWHDSTYHPGNPDHTIDASFSGTAVYVYFIVPNFVAFTSTLVNLSFSIDGTFYNQYEHIPDLNTPTIEYNTLVFHTTNLVNTNHNIQVRASGSNASILLFDNMIYTVDEADPVSSSPLGSVPTSASTPTTSLPPSTPSAGGSSPALGFRSSPPIGAIAGGVAGGMAFLSVLLVLYCCRRKRRRLVLIPRRLTNWATRKTPPLSLPTSMADTFVSPGTRPHAPTLFEGRRGRAQRSTTVSNSDTLVPDHPDHLIADSKEFDSAESEPAEVNPRDSLPRSSTYTGSSRTGGTSELRAQVTLLQDELERLRAEHEMNASLLEPPPRYEE